MCSDTVSVVVENTTQQVEHDEALSKSLQRGTPLWLLDSDYTGAFAFREPVSEIKCSFALKRSSTSARVKWTYSKVDLEIDVEAQPLDFLIRNASYPCPQAHLRALDFVCYESALIFRQHPQNRRFDYHVYVGSLPFPYRRSFRALFHQPGRSNMRFMFEAYEEPDNDMSEYHDTLRELASLVEPPNVTLSYTACNETVFVNCTAQIGPIELYVTTDESIKKHSGAWIDVALDQRLYGNLVHLSRSTSIDEDLEIFVANASIKLDTKQRQFVVCRDRYGLRYRQLERPNCTSKEEPPDRDLLALQCAMGAICQVFILLLASLAWCLWRRARKRAKSTAFVYHHDLPTPEATNASTSSPSDDHRGTASPVYNAEDNAIKWIRRHSALKVAAVEDYLEPRDCRLRKCALIGCLRRPKAWFRLIRQTQILLKRHLNVLLHAKTSNSRWSGKRHAGDLDFDLKKKAEARPKSHKPDAKFASPTRYAKINSGQASTMQHLIDSLTIDNLRDIREKYDAGRRPKPVPGGSGVIPLANQLGGNFPTRLTLIGRNRYSNTKSESVGWLALNKTYCLVEVAKLELQETTVKMQTSRNVLLKHCPVFPGLAQASAISITSGVPPL
ncbi:unnamed protein product [Mesocestoides corti]|uniref:Uncharacterized protein n=1 Tax=Mesocestoides corti TaxID=53468 RepID=A0A0R3U522_MESCO|nr:unnamed protein product [Mesocestoides corti]